ncbi:MAG TPA: type II secretion system inner membrane protein GspF [Rhodocyclaceae bacterium]|nr:type II secretion system inner membrane protein GspF [Rhodocyclaceae bacterium]
MAAFSYLALANDGREQRGVIDADTARAARAILRERGLHPVDVDSLGAAADPASAGRPGKRWLERRNIASSELSLLTRQWSSLLGAGLTAEQSLAALIEQAESTAVRHTLAGVRGEITAGYSLRAALDRHAASFPPVYRASVAAGEKSGQLPAVMEELADYLDRREALRRKTLQALIYPVLVAVVALVIITALMIYVVPQVVSVFQGGKQALPWLTRVLILVSGLLRDYGWLLLASAAASVFVARAALRQDAVRRRWHARLLGLPVLGRHFRTLESARFASTLAMLAGSGVPLLAALEAGKQVLGLLPMQDAVDAAITRVREGTPLSRALAESRRFPALLIHLVASGEQTGRLDAMLKRAALLQESELENRTAVLTSLLEPALLLVMGGFVLLIVLAVMQPIIEINHLFR